MPDTRDAVALRDFKHADIASYSKGDTMTLAANQFEDWKGVGLIRAARDSDAPETNAGHQDG